MTTSLIQISDTFGKLHKVTALLDNASSVNCITLGLANKLQLKRSKETVPLAGLQGEDLGHSMGSISTQIYPHFTTAIRFDIDALIVKKITSALPENTIPKDFLNHINNLQLANPQYYTPTAIDMLLGADLFYKVISGEKIQGREKSKPVAVKSSLGWLIGGGHHATKFNNIAEKDAVFFIGGRTCGTPSQISNSRVANQRVSTHSKPRIHEGLGSVAVMTQTIQPDVSDRPDRVVVMTHIGENKSHKSYDEKKTRQPFELLQTKKKQVLSTQSQIPLDQILMKFWEIESVSSVSNPTWSSVDQLAEQHFTSTFSRNSNGRFVVKYPFKMDHAPLGDSLLIAIRRFQQVERRLSKQPQHKNEYIKFMRAYQELNHMVEVATPDVQSKFRYYIPHHYVIKESSTTTKFRVVFDASCKTTTGVSLNDIMLVGPTIQDSLTDLIMRFRTHKIAITADIEKMYRQIEVSEDHQQYQHIVWRENPDDDLKHYRLRTVTYGTAAAPWLAQRTLKCLAELEGSKFPKAQEIVLNDFYMDDLISGASSTSEAIQLQQDVRDLLNLGGFPLRKFTSNSEAVLEAIPQEARETKTLLTWDDDSSIHTLGLAWNPSKDTLMVKVQPLPNSLKFSKRQILSEIARLFDPLGWLTPVIVKAKMLMQEIWKAKIEWDEDVPENIQQQWIEFRTEINQLQNIQLHRYQQFEGSRQILLGFSDASERAYGAAIYLCSIQEAGSFKMSLVTAKSRIAPVKQQSLPRLELCAAVLLGDLLSSVKLAIKIDVPSTLCFSDSTLVLGWIKSEPYKFHTFIANRIAKVQEHKNVSWHHIPGKDNPADVASRGILPSSLASHQLWWNGPSQLGLQLLDGQLVEPDVVEPVEEQRKTRILLTTPNQTEDIFEKYGSLNQLIRVIAYVFRFYWGIRRKPRGDTPSYLTSSERQNALTKLILLAQAAEFSNEIATLEAKENLTKSSKLLPLNPFLDNVGILRVGGRLRNASAPFDQKFPILLPKNHKLAELIIRNIHLSTLHGGPQIVLSSLQQKYWIIRGKDLVTRIIHKCVTCARQRSGTLQQIMADLPSHRINPAPPFLHCGVDYAGPFLIKPLLPRSKVTMKAYVAVLVCCVTKALHLEVVSEASTEAFLQAFRRFIARRGKPEHMYSDQGTNFQGANNELKTMYKAAFNNGVLEPLAMEGMKWHFNPPAAPHFGGLWEAAVKSMKHHLIRIAGNTRLTFEGLTTLTSQIEAILNSRPLWPESNDPSDLRALTPGHFLIGRPLTSFPETDISEVPTNRLKHWQLIQQMMQHFWKRWNNEYLLTLQQRTKWTTPSTSIREGQLVLLKDENLPPRQWSLARVVKVYPAKDGIIRTVSIKTSKGTYTRPIVKLCPLPID